MEFNTLIECNAEIERIKEVVRNYIQIVDTRGVPDGQTRREAFAALCALVEEVNE